MNKRSLLLLQALIFMAMTTMANASSNEKALHSDMALIKTEVDRRIEMLNEIIKKPDLANTQSWALLGNPHDETELSFYVNSISDGSLAAYDKGAPTGQKLLKHSQTTSKTEPAILLQHLRLALMSFNIRPGNTTPFLKVVSIQPANNAPNEIIVDSVLMANNAQGKYVSHRAAIVFDVIDGEKTEKGRMHLALQKVTVGGHVIYGWWYDLNRQTQ